MKSNSLIRIALVALVAGIAGGAAMNSNATPHPAPKKKATKKAAVKKAPPPIKVYSVADQASRPDASVHRINQEAKDTVISNAVNGTNSAGVSSMGGTTSGKSGKAGPGPVMEPAPAWVPSIGLDYTFVTSDDERADSADGDTHSGSLSFDLVGPNGWMAGLIYQYSNIDLSGPLYGTESDSHFFSVYGAKSLTPWLTAGISGGYGYSDTDVNLIRGTDTSESVDTWSVSPFLAATIVRGSFFAATSVAYQFADQDGEDTHSIILEQSVGYMLTEKLTVSGLVRYHNQLDNGNSNDDEDWLTLGGRIGYRISETINSYAGYEYDALNDSYENHTIKGGVSFSF